MTNGERILVSKHYDPQKQDYFCRPLGGGVEFGERSHDAIFREIKEETGFAITNVKLLGVLESFFDHAGQRGHEIVFVFDAEFEDRGLYDQAELPCTEAHYADFSASWLTLSEIESAKIRLVPEGIRQFLAS
jgi:ADP-ribose pyrophosphatase YjhB (NUDIX family)